MNPAVEKLMSTSLGQILESSDAQELIDNMTTQEIPRGATLFRVDDPGDALYIVVEGALEVILGEGPAATVVATVGAGQIVGELEVMTLSSRVATLSANADATVLALPKATLDNLLANHRPAATKLITYIAKTLARRLAAVNQRIVKRPVKPATPSEGSAKGADARPTDAAPSSSESSGPGTADALGMDDDDLDVLDKLWA